MAQEPFVPPTQTPPETPLFKLNDKVSCVQTIGKTTYGPYNFVINKILPADKGGVIRVSGIAQDGKVHTVPQKICKKTSTDTTPVPRPIADSSGNVPFEELERVALSVPPGLPPPGPVPATPAAAPAADPPARSLEEMKTMLDALGPTPVPAPLPVATPGPMTSSEIQDLKVTTAPLSDQAPDSWAWAPVPNIDRGTFQDLLDKVKAGEIGLTVSFPNMNRRYYATPDGRIVSIEYINAPNFIGVVSKDFPRLKPWFTRGGRTYRRNNKKNKKTLRAKKQ